MDDDWAEPFDGRARVRFEKKLGTFPCTDLSEYIERNDPWAAFYAVRDAALFGESKCDREIRRVEEQLGARYLTRLALSFYRLRRGESGEVENLVSFFDREAIDTVTGRSRDDVTVHLFGFLPDWEQTGRRLIKHRRNADGAVAEMNLNALMWKRFLFGKDPGYDERCEAAASAEGVLKAEASVVCRPPMPE